jgi:Ser/Thr protein kinase RdoA (MazF antagonist)
VDVPAGPPDDVVAAAESAAATWRLGRPRLVRLGMNGIFVAGDTVLRVARPNAPGDVALDLATALAAQGVRVPRPARDGVVHHDDLTVSAWEHVRASGAPVDWPAVGRHVAAVHEIAAADLPAGLPLPTPAAFPWWDFDTLLADVDDLLDAPARTGLRRTLDANRDWNDLLANSPVVCHGDVHPGNVLQAADGPVLLDWDLVCLAPAAWDHAPMMTIAERWGGPPGEYEAFAEGVGWSGRGDRAAETFAVLRLLAATLMRLRAGRTDPRARAEAQRRLRWWRGDPDAPSWNAQ